MHKCWEVPELLTTIFLHTTDDPDPTRDEYSSWPIPGSSTLALLARTSKLFSEPALDILWRFMPGLGPLIRCLPSDAFEIIPGRASSRPRFGGKIRIVKDLRPTDFERMYFYAHRVKTFGISRLSHNARLSQNLFDPIVLSLLWSRRKSNSPILPSIRTSIIPLSEFDNQALYPRLILGPGLRSITITAKHDITNRDLPIYAWDNVKATLMPLVPSLSTFAINAIEEHVSEPLDFGTPRDLMQLYRSFDRLTSLDASSIFIDCASLSHLATLPNLYTLSTSIDTEDLTQFISTYGGPREFPSLSTLKLRVADLCACSRLLCRSGFQQLKALEVSRSRWDTYWDVDRFFETFGTPLSFAELSQLAVSTYVGRSVQTPTSLTMITAKTFTPLLPFTNLSMVQLDLETAVHIDDTVLHSMGIAWPHLETLSIYERNMGALPNITLGGLLALTTTCPKLEDITLRVNALSSIPNFSQTGDFVPAEGLRFFNVCTSPVGAPHIVAPFLVTAFPNLAELRYGWLYVERNGDILDLSDGLESDYYKSWGEIHEILSPIMASHLD